MLCVFVLEGAAIKQQHKCLGDHAKTYASAKCRLLYYHSAVLLLPAHCYKPPPPLFESELLHRVNITRLLPAMDAQVGRQATGLAHVHVLQACRCEYNRMRLAFTKQRRS